MSRVLGYITAVLAVILVVAGAGDLSTRSVTCMACHTREAAYAEWMAAKLKAEKRGFSHELIACAQCHLEGAAAGTIGSRFEGLLHAVTYLVPQIDPRGRGLTGLTAARVRIPSANCKYCHAGALVRKAVMLRDLPPRLREIGLAMDHGKHVVTREDTCARCHERYKEKDQGVADKDVNYAEVNHLNCDACHTYASHAYRAGHILPQSEREFQAAREAVWKSLEGNPRWMVAIPTEKSCRRCHNGKIHFKTRIFEADCRNGSNYETCVKCHPLMTREFFKRYGKDRERVVSAPNGDGPGS